MRIRQRLTRAGWIRMACVIIVAGGVTGGILLTQPYHPPSLPKIADKGTTPADKPPATPSASPSASPSAAVYPRITPTQVIVPAIGVNAPVEPVGLCPSTNPNWDCSGYTSPGGLATPALSAENLTGWWEGGFAPGQDGPAVIVGHIDSAAAGPLVFWKLGDLKPDDLIETEPGNLWFTVTAVQEVSKTSFPTQAVYGATGYPALRLITCGGAFDSTPGTADYGHYLSNIVVYATLTTAISS